MLIEQELAAWLADRHSQQQTQQAIEGFATSWRSGATRGCIKSNLATSVEPDAATVAEAVGALFGNDAWLDDLIGGLSDALRSNPFFEPPFPAISSEIHAGLVIHDDANVTIAVGVTKADQLAAKKNVARGRVSVGFTGYVSVLKFIAAGDAFLSFWEAPPITEDFTAASAGRCRRTGGRRIEDGEILVCDGRFQSYVIEHARSNMIIVQATVKTDQAPLSVEYDAASHEYVGCSATDDSSSRIQMIATLLRKLGRSDAFPVIAAFLDHRDFFVRWHVMRELLGLDALAALPHLENMAAADPHPDNRAAAAKVLAQLQMRRAA